VSDFDDVLNQQQLVRDSAGNYYEAPYSAYQNDGPQGPGYYLPDGTSLSPASH
jgi:hypothetical protein